jgi:hypothetical protein
MKELFTNAFFMPVKPFATAPGPLKGCDSQWSDVSMHALIQVEDVLSISNSTVITLGACNVNVLCQLQVKYEIVER